MDLETILSHMYIYILRSLSKLCTLGQLYTVKLFSIFS